VGRAVARPSFIADAAGSVVQPGNPRCPRPPPMARLCTCSPCPGCPREGHWRASVSGTPSPVPPGAPAESPCRQTSGRGPLPLSAPSLTRGGTETRGPEADRSGFLLSFAVESRRSFFSSRSVCLSVWRAAPLSLTPGGRQGTQDGSWLRQSHETTQEGKTRRPSARGTARAVSGPPKAAEEEEEEQGRRRRGQRHRGR